MVALTSFYDDIMPRVPGADEPLVLHELGATVRQFCEEGLAWDFNYGPVNIDALSVAHTISVGNGLPTGTAAVYLLRTEFKRSGETEFRDFDPLLSLPANPDEQDVAPNNYYAERPDYLLLFPVPTVNHPGGFRATVALVPTALDTDLPDTFSTHWRDTIIDGVLYRMYTMNAKPWANPSMAVVHGRRFRSAIKRSRDIVKRRYGTASSGWRFPYFAAQ